MARKVIASGQRFELLRDPDLDVTTLRHLPSARGVHFSGEDADALCEDIQGGGGHVDRQLAKLWFQEGYAAHAEPDEGIENESAAHDEELR